LCSWSCGSTELEDAVTFNPYDADAFASALTTAIDMPPTDGRGE
jgi:trehalose-6-phosphate synthase